MYLVHKIFYKIKELYTYNILIFAQFRMGKIFKKHTFWALLSVDNIVNPHIHSCTIVFCNFYTHYP